VFGLLGLAMLLILSLSADNILGSSTDFNFLPLMYSSSYVISTLTVFVFVSTLFSIFASLIVVSFEIEKSSSNTGTICSCVAKESYVLASCFDSSIFRCCWCLSNFLPLLSSAAAIIL